MCISIAPDPKIGNGEVVKKLGPQPILRNFFAIFLMRAEVNSIELMCDRYVASLEGESPLRALVRRTVREGKGAHREVGSEESRIQNVGPTNR